MIVIPYKTVRDRRARRGTPALPAGSKVFCITHRGQFYSWLYKHRETAVKVAKRLEVDAFDAALFDFNFSVDPERASYSELAPSEL